MDRRTRNARTTVGWISWLILMALLGVLAMTWVRDRSVPIGNHDVGMGRGRIFMATAIPPRPASRPPGDAPLEVVQSFIKAQWAYEAAIATRTTPADPWRPTWRSHMPIWTVGIPVWMVILPMGALSWWLRPWAKRFPPGHCRTCGYQRAGLAPEGACPEC